MGNSTFTAPANEQTLIDTGLNALANDAIKISTAILDNTSNRFYNSVIELVLSSVDLTSQSNPAADLYLVPSYDGTNYADTGTDDSTTIYPPAQYFLAAMGVAKTSAVHRAVSSRLMLDPLKYKAVLINKTGAGFGATNNTLKVKTYTNTTA